MIPLPIDLDETKNAGFSDNLEWVEVMNVYPGFYKRIGFIKPWIGYFAPLDGNEIIGCGGFKGKAKEGKIAYGTFKNYEGRGIAKEVCRQLGLLSLETDRSLRITARTLMDTNASTRYSKKWI